MADVHAARALALVGTRFRAQGRDPESGLDCVGLVLCAFGLTGEPVRTDYRLRGYEEAALRAVLERLFDVAGRPRAGDVALLRVASDQFHLGIISDVGLIHADAGLRRVVERPGPAPWPVIATYRARTAELRD